MRTMKKQSKNGRLPSSTFGITRVALVPLVLRAVAFVASILTTWLHRMQLMVQSSSCTSLADQGWYLPSRSMSSLMSVMVKTSMMPLLLTLFFTSRNGMLRTASVLEIRCSLRAKKKITPRNGMMTSLWVTNFAWRDAGQLVLYTPGGVRHMSASDVSPFHPLPACFTPLSDTCPLAFWFGLCLCGVCVFVLVGCVSLSCFCKWQSSFQVSSVIQLQVTDNASMLARLGDKKKSRQRNVRSMLSANFRLICGPAGIRAGEQSVSERSKSITKPTRPQRRLFPYRLQQISRTQAVHN